LLLLMFLFLGALLYLYADSMAISLPFNDSTGDIITDKVFPLVVFNYMPAYLGIVFLIGLLAAAYSSADSALTSLTTSYCVDILGKLKTPKKTRMLIHLAFTLLLFGTIVVFRYVLEASVIKNLFTLASYTYGPLLGLFAFGILTKKQIKDKTAPYLAVLAPVLTFLINKYSQQLFVGYQFGFELLLINGFVMFVGLWLVSKK